MKKIFKYKLQVTSKQTIEMPVGAEILSVQFQRQDLFVWALVDPDAEKEGRVFDIFGTGEDVPAVDAPGASRKHLATLQVQNGSFVCHVFEVLFSN